jgi:hypothetical protein
VHRKFNVLLMEELTKEEYSNLPQRDPGSLMNRFQRQIQKNLNVFNKYYRRVKQEKPSGTPTEEGMLALVADTFRHEEGYPFIFMKCVPVLHVLPKFNPMLQVQEVDIDLTEDGEEEDGDKKPAAVNHIGAPMGANLPRPMGNKRAKKLLQERSSLSSESGFQMMASTHAAIAHEFKRRTDQESLQRDKEALRMEFEMHREMGDMVAAAACLKRVSELNERIKTAAAEEDTAVSSTAVSSTDQLPPLAEVGVEAMQEEIAPGDAPLEDGPAAV